MTRTRSAFPALAGAALSMLCACGGGAGSPPTSSPGGAPQSPTPAPSATPTMPPSLSADKGFTISAQTGAAGLVNGLQSWYGSGVSVPWTPTPGSKGQNGDTSVGATPASGFPAIDGMSCAPTQEPAASTSTYSTHAFVGIYYGGAEYALPQAIGMNAPTEPIASGHPNDNYEIESSSCEYNVHTHDYTGLVHIEDARYPQSTSTTSPLPYAPTLQTLFDVWGVQITGAGLSVPGQAPLSGPVSMYYGSPGADVGPHGAPVTDAYTLASSASAISLGFHQTIWIVVGALPSLPDGATGLPQVEWRIQF